MNEFKVGENVVLVCNTFGRPVFEDAVVLSIEESFYVVQRKNGVLNVPLDGQIINWGNGSHMRKVVGGDRPSS